MKKDDLSKVIQMLTTQLHEEEEDYNNALTDKRTSNDLSKIIQRIQSIKKLLTSSTETHILYKPSATLSIENF